MEGWIMSETKKKCACRRAESRLYWQFSSIPKEFSMNTDHIRTRTLTISWVFMGQDWLSSTRILATRDMVFVAYSEHRHTKARLYTISWKKKHHGAPPPHIYLICSMRLVAIPETEVGSERRVFGHNFRIQMASTELLMAVTKNEFQ